MTKHGHELLDQFIHHVSRWTRLAHNSKVLPLGLVKVSRGTNKEPDGIFRREVEASEPLEPLVLAQPCLYWEQDALAVSLTVDTRFSVIPCTLELGVHARAEGHCAPPGSSVLSHTQRSDQNHGDGVCGEAQVSHREYHG